MKAALFGGVLMLVVAIIKEALLKATRKQPRRRKRSWGYKRRKDEKSGNGAFAASSAGIKSKMPEDRKIKESSWMKSSSTRYAGLGGANSPLVRQPGSPIPPQDSIAALEIKPYQADRNYSEDLMDRGGAYVARSHLMSPTERDVYKVLEKAYGDKYHIFSQVRVVDLVNPNVNKYRPNSREYLSLFRQISQWHFDYVLCRREDFRIFCALELDDSSHKRPDRMKRDRIINRVCKEAGLRLERMVVDHQRQEVRLVEKAES